MTKDDSHDSKRTHAAELKSIALGDSTLDHLETLPEGRTTAAAPTVIGPYTIEHKIAEGGMGAVYVAHQSQPVRRKVALKVIKAETDSQQIIARFEAERQALAMMDHPNIARIFDGGTTPGGSPYFVMELVNGVPITKHCDAEKLSVRERLKLFIPVCQAIQHAHNRGILHRDIKPSNVLVAIHEGSAVPKVIDFGLAKATDHKNLLTDKTMFTEHGQIVGTLQYMSPEQAEVDLVDTRTDIYSLGVLLYELLTGSTPIDRDTIGQNALLKILEMIRESEPPKPSSRLADSSDTITKVSAVRNIEPSQLRQVLRGELDWVVMKAIEKDRERRYGNAEKFAEDLNRFLSDQTVNARPPSFVYRTQKYIKRNRGRLVTLSAVLALIVAMSILIPAIVSSQRETAIARIEQSLDSQLGNLTLADSAWDEAQTQIDELRLLDAKRSRSAASRLTDALMSSTQQVMSRPRLSTQELDEIKTSLSRLTNLNLTSEQVQRLVRLNAELQGLNAGWSRLFDADIVTKDSLSSLFSASTTNSESGGLQLTAASPISNTKNNDAYQRASLYAPLTMTQQVCMGDMRVEAQFVNWQASHEVGISLNVDKQLGYDFVLTSFGTNDENAGNSVLPLLGGIREGNGLFHLQVRRGDATLLDSEVPSVDVEDGILRIVAKREGSQLTIQVNRLPPRQVIEPFFFRTSDEGYVGVRGRAGVEILSLRGETREGVDQSPLRRADDLFVLEQFDSAFDAYQLQASRTERGTAVYQESQFKAAVCMQRLGRDEEAQTRFAELMSAEGEIWPAMAGIFAWDLAVQSKDTEQAEAAYVLLRTTGRLARAASLAPAEVRNRIIREAGKQIQFDDFLAADADRLSNLQRAAEIDRLFSFDGQGTLRVQIELARALRMEERFQDAADVLLPLWERTKSFEALRRYCRMLEKLGRSTDALALVEGELYLPGVDQTRLFQVRAAMHFSRKDFEATTDSLLASQRAYEALGQTGDIFNFAKTQLMLGMMRRREGDLELANDHWRKAYELLNDLNYTTEGHTVYLPIAAGLCGDLSVEESSRLMQAALKKYGGGAITSLVSPQSVQRCLNKMWRSDRGIQVAEEFLFDSANLQQRVIRPVTLAASEYLRQNGFPGEVTAAEDEQIWDFANAFVSSLMLENDFTMAQCAQLGLVWKGASGAFGWNLIKGALDEDSRAQFAYIMGHRSLQQGKVEIAKNFFSEVVQLRANSSITQLAEKSIELMNNNEGQISLFWNGPNPLPMTILNSSGETINQEEVVASHSIRLPVGEYSIQFAPDTNQLARNIKVTRGRSIELDLKSQWTPGKQETRIHGLLSHPAKLDGINQWQLVRQNSVAATRSFDFSPSGDRIAIVCDDGVLRIQDYGEKDCESAVVRYPARFLTVDWAPDGSVIAAGQENGHVLFVDPNTLEVRSWDVGTPSHIRYVRWNPTSDRLAVACADWKVRIVSADGSLVAQLDDFQVECKHVAWSEDGHLLSTVGMKEALVWNTENWEIVRRYDSVPSRAFAGEWSPDQTKMALAGENDIVICDARTGEVLHQRANEKRLSSIAWDPQSNDILLTGHGFSPFRWKVGSPEQDAETISQYGSGPVKTIENGALIGLSNYNGYIVVKSDGGKLDYVHYWPAPSFWSVDFDKTGTRAVLVFESRETQLLDMATLQSTKLDTKPSQCADFHPTEDVLVFGSNDGGVQLVGDVGKGPKVLDELDLGDSSIFHVLWNPIGGQVFAADMEGRVYSIPVESDLEAKEEGVLELGQPTELIRCNGKINGWAISPNGQFLIAGNHNKNPQVVSTADGSVVHTFENTLGFRTAAFSPDGKTLVLGINDTSRIYSADSWDMQGETLSNPSWSYVYHMCSAGERTFALASESGGLYLLDAEKREFRRICQHAAFSNVQHSTSGTLWCGTRFGAFREIDVRSGQVLSLMAATRGDQVAYFGPGGELKTGLDSLLGLACIVDTEDGRQFVAAREFYEKHATENP